MTDTAATIPEIEITRHQLRRRVLQVDRCETLTPLMRRIVLTGNDLEPEFPYYPMAIADHVKIMFPNPETGELVVPDIADNRLAIDPQQPAPVFRDYTVRDFNSKTGELTIDFVLHEHGVAGQWAINAKPGDEIGVFGPRGSKHYPTTHPWYILGGDETALPALSRWIEELPACARGVAIIEVPSAEEVQELTGDAGIEVRYLYREGKPSRLEQALRAVELPDSEYFVWMAGEAGMLRPIRRYFRKELGLPPERAEFDGYWKIGTVNLDHHATDEDD